MILISIKIVVLFIITSADFVLICIEKYDDFERNEAYETVFLKWTDYKDYQELIWLFKCQLLKVLNLKTCILQKYDNSVLYEQAEKNFLGFRTFSNRIYGE